MAIKEDLENKILFPDSSTVCNEKTPHPVDEQFR